MFLTFDGSHAELIWEGVGSKCSLIVSPQHIDRECIHTACKQLLPYFNESFLWLQSSGTTSSSRQSVGVAECRWVALSRQACLNSAEAVNSFLKSTSEDSWLLALPTFHVGGLAILARAYLSGAKVIDLQPVGRRRWSAQQFHDAVVSEQATLASLVPTQLYDLLDNPRTARPPPSLRALFIGGAALSSELMERANSAGWPLIVTYGLTECASQVAVTQFSRKTTSLSGSMKLLPHIKAIIGEDQRLLLSSRSLLHCYGWPQFSGHPKIEFPMNEQGWFLTEDRASLFENGELVIHGRVDDFVKINGEKIDLSALQRLMNSLLKQEFQFADAVIYARPEARCGAAIHLAIEVGKEAKGQLLLDDLHKDAEKLLNTFNSVAPNALSRAAHYHLIEKLPRTSLGKVQRNFLPG